ncbi:YjbH domain-containing protein [Dyadobacter chenwenxiniae]|uniref:YjbH domain-containing protein n=1 Tax=Dyadobacter chenwenxiniae TaxID=2906456 RepID=A0A9X1PH44_9BACT|nr:YjbH domain-containing protein [Dyadobacter chenwenxiniae]MCF0060511.1 YjbH domain-containing protein [Dyadobacter chenwenxiniae]UON86243.1 YjbH domain-containing protein [Dyadobacter chenwenxiniae]
MLVIYGKVAAQSNISGKPGLIYTPTARYVPDGNMEIGLHFFPGKYGFNSDNQNPGRVLSMNLTVLPRFDININVLQLFSTAANPVKLGLGDRQLDFRYLLMKESKNRPSVAFITSTPTSISPTLLTHALVATKHIHVAKQWEAEVTAGYGSPYHIYRKGSTLDNYGLFANMAFEKKEDYAYHKRYLEGPFGGVSFTYKSKFGLMLEYDSQNINAGVYVKAFKNWVLQAAVLNGEQITFGSAYNFSLLKQSRRMLSLGKKQNGDNGQTPADPQKIIIGTGYRKLRGNFENVTLDSTGVISYEQRLNRNPFPALYQLKQLYADSADMRFVPLFQGIPIAQYKLSDKLEMSEVSQEFRERHKMRTKFPLHRNGYSLDFWVQPYFNAIFGNFDKPVQSNTSIAIQSQILLLPGMSLDFGILFPIVNDLDSRPKKIRPSPVFLNQFYSKNHNHISASAGFFQNDQYGVNIQYRRANLQQPWSFGVEAGLTGDYYYPDKGVYYGNMEKLLLILDAAYLLSNPDITFKVSAGRYLAGDTGVRLDMLRQFSNVEIGFYAMTTSNGSTIGFNFAIPLFPGKLLNGKHVRFRTSSEFPWEYNYTRGYRIGERYRTGYQLDQKLRQYHRQYLGRQYGAK